MQEIRVLSPCGGLGYGFPEASIKEAMLREPHIIAVDAGSTDPGPHYLGSGEGTLSRDAQKNDLKVLLAEYLIEHTLQWARDTFDFSKIRATSLHAFQTEKKGSYRLFSTKSMRGIRPEIRNRLFLVNIRIGYFRKRSYET